MVNNEANFTPNQLGIFSKTGSTRVPALFPYLTPPIFRRCLLKAT